MLNKILFIVTLILISSSCTSFTKSSFKKDKNIKFSSLSGNWHPISKDQSDLAYQNKESLSIIFVNSNCKKYLGSSLKALFDELYGDVAELQIKSQTIQMFKNREALITETQIQLDGIERTLLTVLTKKNRCLYDFVLISTNSYFLKNDRKDFINFIKNGSY